MLKHESTKFLNCYNLSFYYGLFLPTLISIGVIARIFSFNVSEANSLRAFGLLELGKVICHCFQAERTLFFLQNLPISI